MLSQNIPVSRLPLCRRFGVGIFTAALIGSPVLAQEPPAPTATPAVLAASVVKPPRDIVDLDVGFVTIRKRRSLAPRTYLYVDLNGLEKGRYTVLRPEDPATYDVARPTGDNTPSSSDAARASMGVPPKPKERETVAPAVPAAPPAPKIKAPKIQGMRLPGESGEDPVYVSKVVITNNVARLSIKGMVRGDKLRLTLRNVAENVTLDPATPVSVTPAPATPPAPDTTSAPAATDAATNVTVAGTRTVDLQTRKIVEVTESIGPTFRPNLVYASNQKLSNGKSKSVFQIPLLFEIPSIGEKKGANVYVRSDNLISTDSKDVASRLNFTVGRERNTARDPGMRPEHLDLHIDTNQSFKNASLGFGYGVKWRLGSSSDPLWENALRSETGVLVSFDTYLNYRLKKDTENYPHHASNWDFAIVPGIEGPALKLFRLPSATKPVQMVYGAKLYLLPFEKGANGKPANYVESSFNLGFLIPLPRLLGADRQLRIDIVTGTNPVSGYARSQTTSYRLVASNMTF